MKISQCQRCAGRPIDFLREIAFSRDRSLDGIVQRAEKMPDSPLWRIPDCYLSDECQPGDIAQLSIVEGMRNPDSTNAPSSLPRNLIDQAVRKAIEEYEKRGYVEIKDGIVRITSLGARKLAGTALDKILANLGMSELGSHSVSETGFGSDISVHTRKYEAGDDYSMANIERTAINALERKGRLELEPIDFAIHEEIHQSKLCVGLIIDESGSMKSQYKLEAAIETALALAELIEREPKDTLKVFVFSEVVREIQPWTIINEALTEGWTDVRGAMKAFRKSAMNETGDKQAYLISDIESNTENGVHIGFEKATEGVKDEAANFRRDNISLNIVMLDAAPWLKKTASALARRNLGRVFFTAAPKLGQVVIEDYLKSKKETL